MKKLDRTNTNAFTTHLPFIFFMIGSFLIAYQLINNSPLSKVKKGTHELFCTFYVENGPADRRKVDPDLVTDYVEGTWLFVNGSANNCELVSRVKRL